MHSGVLAHARSADMLTWEAAAPALTTGRVRRARGRPGPDRRRPAAAGVHVPARAPGRRADRPVRDGSPPGMCSATRSPAPGTCAPHCLLRPIRSYRRLRWCNAATAPGPFWGFATPSCRARRRWRSSIRSRWRCAAACCARSDVAYSAAAPRKLRTCAAAPCAESSFRLVVAALCDVQEGAYDRRIELFARAALQFLACGVMRDRRPVRRARWSSPRRRRRR